MTDVIIIGGGIAGPLTALALARLGREATVFEAYPRGQALDAGAFLTIAVNGLSAMREVGVDGRVKACGFPSRAIEFMNGKGKVLGTLPLGGELADGTVTHTLRRAELHRVLYEEACARGVRFEHEKRLLSAEVLANGRVEARFADGSRVTADLLVGADGVHSRVRTCLDPRAPRPRYAGLLSIGGVSPRSVSELPVGDYRMIFGKRCFFGLTVAPSGEVWWFANPGRKHELAPETLAAMTREHWQAELCELLRDDATDAAAIVECATEVVATHIYELPFVPVWHKGPMVIIGDAAHAASPASGQGAAMAAEDAVTLASCLHAHPYDVESALRAYESARRARVQRVVAYGARSGSPKTVGPVGRVLRDMVLPWFLRRQAHASAASLAWLFHHEVALTPARSETHMCDALTRV